MEDTLEKGVELKINFEKLGSKLYLFEKDKREEKRENMQQGLLLLLVLNLRIRGQVFLKAH